MDQNQGKVLLVEGPDDKRVIAEILKKWDAPEIYIKECGGCSQLYKMFPLYLSNPDEYKTIGVILDADTNPEGRLQRFVQLLNESGRYEIDATVHLPADGLIIDTRDADTARVGLWVMPDNHSHGMLETFLSELAEATCPQMMTEADRALINIEQKGIQQYTPVHRPKAKIHTYLAWQKEPGRTLACAVTKHYLDASDDKARPFIEWVKQLFA